MWNALYVNYLRMFLDIKRLYSVCTVRMLLNIKRLYSVCTVRMLLNIKRLYSVCTVRMLLNIKRLYSVCTVRMLSIVFNTFLSFPPGNPSCTPFGNWLQGGEHLNRSDADRAGTRLSLLPI